MFTFEQTPYQLNNHILMLIPKDISSSYLTKGMNMGAIEFHGYSPLNGIYPMEPDGKGGHFFLLDKELLINNQLLSLDQSLSDSNINCPITITVDINIPWQEPTIPVDLLEELINSETLSMWNGLTTKAKWEWIRWIRSTSNSDTRYKRILTATSMLSSGKRRPCCFNTTLCTLPSISKSGIVISH